MTNTVKARIGWLFAFASSLTAGCSEPADDADTSESVTEEQALQETWALNPAKSLAYAARNTSAIRICAEWRDVAEPFPAHYAKRAAELVKISQNTLQEWLALDPRTKDVAVSLDSPTARALDRCPRPDLARGTVRLFLYDDEPTMCLAAFPKEEPVATLAVYVPDSGTIYVNVKGVSDRRREPTGGATILRHEWGHALGLAHNHNDKQGSVMKKSRPAMSDSMTSSDAAAYKGILDQIAAPPRRR